MFGPQYGPRMWALTLSFIAEVGFALSALGLFLWYGMGIQGFLSKRPIIQIMRIRLT